MGCSSLGRLQGSEMTYIFEHLTQNILRSRVHVSIRSQIQYIFENLNSNMQINADKQKHNALDIDFI